MQSFNDFAGIVEKRTLLVGGLAESRFRWDAALRNLSRSMPEDVTLDTITATTAGSAAGTDNTNDATMEMKGCASNWIGMSRFMVRMRNLPGVKDVVATDGNRDPAAASGGGQDSGKTNRMKNCGLQPVSFGVKVIFEPQLVDLVDLPKIDNAPAGGATGASGAVPATPAPAAMTTPGGN
ncbi:MAG: hypothetical protein JJE27_07715 [Thermoleophilia bacterium]|nr:hypothetical protein [Thermoleophilia bacterium]